MRKFLLFSPLALLLIGAFFLFSQLQQDAIPPAEDWRGKPFPEFEVRDLLSQQPRLKQDLPTEPLIINVWASWCTWCVLEFPELARLKAAGVPVIGLTYAEHPDDARAMLVREGNPFSMVLDDSQYHFLATTLKIQAAPTTYLLDGKGMVRYQHRGYYADLAQDLLARWQALRTEEGR